MTEKKQEITPGELRKFSIGLAVILVALAAFQVWRGHSTAAWIIGGGGWVSFLLALARPQAMKPVHSALSRVGHALGWINTRIILALIYYLLFTPAALLMKLFGRDPLKRKLEPETPTYWIRKPAEERGKERYEKMY
jgi:hypothetical protein